MSAREILALAVVSFVVAAGLAGRAVADDAVAQMDALWASRIGADDNAKKILDLADAAFAAAPSYDVAWRAARAAFWICISDPADSKETKRNYGKKAWDWGLKATALNPNGVEGYTWGAVGIGEYSKGVGVTKAVGQGLAKKYEAWARKAVSLDADYDHGTPLRAMGLYYQKLPWPLRDSAKAEEYFKRAIALAPCMIRSYFYLADLYREDKKWDKARATLAAGLAQEPCPDETREGAWFKRQMQKLAAGLPAN